MLRYLPTYLSFLGADLNTMGKNGSAGDQHRITPSEERTFKAILKQFPNQLHVKAQILENLFYFNGLRFTRGLRRV